MSDAHKRLHELRDDNLPLFTSLLGDGAGRFIAEHASQAGTCVVQVKPTHVSWRPGKSVAVRYDAQIASKGAGVTTEHFVAVTGIELPNAERSQPPALPRHSSSSPPSASRDRATIWQLPNDPWLPGLSTALDPAAARGLLDSFDAPAGTVSPKRRAYRATRRAVVELTIGDRRLFVKAVLPKNVQGLQLRHEVLSQRLQVPRSYGCSERHGVVVMDGLSGRTLRACLDDRTADLPAPTALAAMLDRIPNLADGRERRPVLARTRGHAKLLRLLIPETRAQIDRVASAIEHADESDPLMPVHGDLYEKQLLVEHGAFTGMIDIDTVALGRRSDDWATLLAHLSMLEESNRPVLRDRAREYSKAVLTIADEQTNSRATLRLKIAGAVLSLATGPFRVQNPQWPSDTVRRIALAERWTREANKVTRASISSARNAPARAGAELT